MKSDPVQTPPQPAPQDAAGPRFPGLSPAARALLDRRSGQKDSGSVGERLMHRRVEYQTCPLSFAQQRLWFLDQLEPGGSAYNMPAILHLSGPVDLTALDRSLNEIVRRHEALRTTIALADGEPVQIIAPTLTLPLPVVDLSDLPESQREAEVRGLVTREIDKPFDLMRGPLFRGRLLRSGEEDHVLILTLHHIVSDGWSLHILFRELGLLYQAFSTGRSSSLAELTVQYADYAMWQRECLQGAMLAEQLDYWKRQLAGAPAVLELPTDRPAAAVHYSKGARETMTISIALRDALDTLSRSEGATRFMTFLAAFQVLLGRYAGLEDVVVGSPIAGRIRAETEGVIGLFLNTLALRTDLSGNPTFRELLGRVREVALGAYAHQEVPFERVVEELQPERDLSRHPLFDIMLNFVNIPARELSGFASSFLERPEPEPKFLMTLYVREQKDELRLSLVYRRELFSPERALRMLDQYRYLLEQIVAAPGDPIQSYSLVTPASRGLLPDPQATLPEPRHQPVTELFLAWVHRAPHQPAIQQGDRICTYTELAVMGSNLARVLLARGLGRGDVVAVMGPRSPGLTAGIIGVFLSGGVLLAIDRGLPPSRQRLMLQEAGAKHLLYVGDRRSEDGWLGELAPLVLTSVTADTGQASGPEPARLLDSMRLPELTPDDAAYIFFTSGTSGTPKGVLGCHKGLSHFLKWQRDAFAIGPADRVAQLTGLSFDVVLRDLFLPLTSGATLCLPGEDDDLGADRILPWLQRHGISVLHTVPALAHSWLAGVPPSSSLPALRWVFFAGEPLTESLVRRWREAFGEDGGIVNLYGPTETTLAKCSYRVPADIPSTIQPLGWPLPETQALVLSGAGRLCGIGEPGEIVLRTPFGTRGYVNAPQECQARFVPNHFRFDPRDLLYHTGDRGRYRLDGSLEFLGRTDDQVKIRGIRVEPAEVEMVLSRHPAVRAVAVLAREDIPGDKRLVAYVVLAGNPAEELSRVRNFAKEHLPDYMVPAEFVSLDRLPLSSNGKLDRRALPAPVAVGVGGAASFVDPRTPVEELLARIWAEVLGLDRVGIEDNFFALGGHSLLAIQVMARLRDELGIELALRALFETPTVTGLAGRILQVDQTP